MSDSLPHNLDAEAAVLGACLVNSDAIDEVVDLLTPNDFYSHFHAECFSAIIKLSTSDQQVDYLSVIDSMRTYEPGMVTALTDKLPTSRNIATYIKIVKTYAVKRALIGSAKKIEQLAASEEQDPEALVALAIGEIDSIDESDDKISDGKDIANIAVEYAKELVTPGYRYMTNSRTFDEYAPVPGNLFTILSQSSVGKTSLSIALHNRYLLSGKKPFFASAEMTKKEISHKIIAERAGVPMDDLANPEHPALYEFGGWLSKMPCSLQFETRAEKIAHKITRFAKAGKCDVAFIDFLQMLSFREEKDDHKRVASAIQLFKDVATANRIPVFVTSQVTMKDGQATPRWAQEIWNTSDIMMYMWREGVHAKKRHVEVWKNRTGKTGGFEMNLIDGNAILPA